MLYNCANPDYLRWQTDWPPMARAMLEVAERSDLDDAAAELEKLGHRMRVGTRQEAELRHVHDFIAFQDPTGNNIELVWRPAMSNRRYHGERDAGITGFSHVGLCSTDVVRDEQAEHAGIFAETSNPDVPRTVNNPIRLGFAKPRVSGLPAAVGQHSEEILRELGHSESEIAALKKAGALG